MKKSTRIISIVLTVLMLASTFSSFVFASKDEKNVTTVAELIEALGNKEIGTIKLANDLVLNEDVTYTYENEYVIVKKGAEQLAKINARTLEVAEGSLETLTKWEPKALKDMTLDGQGHKIVGLFVDGGAMFSDIAVDAKVVNLDLVNALVLPGNPEERTNTNHYEWSAVLAQRLYGDIEDINVSGAVVLSAAYPIIEKVYTGTTHTGGVVSRTYSTSNPQEETHCPLVKDVTFAGEVVVRNHADKQVNAGGIVSQSFGGKLLNCVNYGNVTVLSGTTYGVGGVAGLVEATAGQITATAPIESKPIGNNYVFNCANVGTVTNSKDSGSRAAGGVIGFCDPYWSANSTMQFVNLYNGGKVINTGKGVIGSCNVVDAAGNLVNGKAEFIYADMAVIPSETGSFNAKLNPVTERIASVPADAAVYFLNCNAGNIEGAYAWKLENGKAVVDFGKTPDAPKTPEEWKYDQSFIPLYDPNTEIAMLSAKVIGQDKIEVKFSEPVKYTSGACWVSLRYCTVSATGIPTLAYQMINEKNTALQIGVTFPATDGSDTVVMSCSSLLKALDNKYWEGIDTSKYVLTLAIEGLDFGENVPGYVDGVTSTDGTKLLKVSNGKSNSDGIHDGAYVRLENPYAGQKVWTVPAYEEGDLALLGAELVAPGKLKLNFTLPVKVTKAPFSGIRYKLKADVESSAKPGYSKNAKGEVLQYMGSLTTDEEGNCYFTTTYDLLPVLEGKGIADGLQPDADKDYEIFFCIEGLDNAGDNTPYVIDNVQSLDGTKRLVCSPSFYDTNAISETNPAIRGIFDGAYAPIAAHTEHTYGEKHVFDGTNHWIACSACGQIKPETTKEAHQFGSNGVCEICGYENYVIVDAPEFKYIKYYNANDELVDLTAIYEANKDNSLDATGKWRFFNGTHLQNKTAFFSVNQGNSFEITFDGTGIEWHTQYRGLGTSGVAVYVDGKLVKSIDGASISAKDDTTDYVIYGVKDLENGRHTLRCEALSSSQMPVDFFKVFGTPVETVAHEFEDETVYQNLKEHFRYFKGSDTDGFIGNHVIDETTGDCEVCKAHVWTLVDAPETGYIRYYDDGGNLLEGLEQITEDDTTDEGKNWRFFNGTHLQNRSGFFGQKVGVFFEIDFNGTGIEYYTQYRAPKVADIEIYIDGVLKETVTGLSADNATDRHLIYGVYDLKDGKHTFKALAKTAGQLPIDFLLIGGKPVGQYVPGDVDGNEELTSDDAIYLLYHIYFGEDYPINQSADMDGDGDEDPDDAIYLLYHVYFGDDYPIGGKKDN